MWTYEPGRGLAARAGGSDVRHEVALVGAVTATLAVTITTTLIMVATALWSFANGGWPPARQGLLDALTFVGLATAIAMTVSYALGLPIALALEKRLGGRARHRIAFYGSAGAVVGGLVGLGFAGATPIALIFGVAGLVAAVGGAVGVGWARARPVSVARRRGWAGTLALTSAALVGWLLSGLILIPLLAAALVGSSALLGSAIFRPRAVHDVDRLADRQ